MLKQRLILILLCLMSFSAQAGMGCSGRFLNPVTGVCWGCLFPLSVSGFKIFSSENDATVPESKKDLICMCGDPIPRIGIPVSFTEPFRVADVTRTPYCMVNMGGTKMSLGLKPGDGEVHTKRGGKYGGKESFYHVHWYVYPLMAWMELITRFACMDPNSGFDIAYMSELDPLWDDDELTFWMNPEAILFANPIAEAACVVDCAKSSFTHGINAMFWCSGCRGGVYPLNGHIKNHIGGVESSIQVLEKMIFKLHREFLLFGALGKRGACGLYPMPWWDKKMYKIQMTYPRVNKTSTMACNPIGKTTAIWGAGKEYPVKGEHFGYVIWRRRDCCVL